MNSESDNRRSNSVEYCVAGEIISPAETPLSDMRQQEPAAAMSAFRRYVEQDILADAA